MGIEVWGVPPPDAQDAATFRLFLYRIPRRRRCIERPGRQHGASDEARFQQIAPPQAFRISKLFLPCRHYHSPCTSFRGTACCYPTTSPDCPPSPPLVGCLITRFLSAKTSDRKSTRLNSSHLGIS